MDNPGQEELIDAIADETTHLRAELNAIKAELRVLRDDLRRMALADDVPQSCAAFETARLPQHLVPAMVQAGTGRGARPAIRGKR